MTFFDITVKEVSRISVKTMPAKTEYEVNENLDTAGLVLTATYNDNTTDDVTEGFTTEGFDSTLGGEKTVTVTYEGKTTTFTVTVLKRVASIEVKTNPTKAEYEVGDTLDTAGLVLTATYNDNTTDDVTAGFTTEGFSSELGGEKTVTVTYEGKTTTFTVNVVKRVSSIAVKTNPGKIEYEVNENLNTASLILTLNYNDGTTKEVAEGFTVSGFDSTEPGEKTITVSYEGKTCTFVVMVLDPTLPGDVNMDEEVNDADAIYLLMHTFFPEMYPIADESACDYNGDGEVNDADAIYLLMYTFFPEMYPIDLQAGKARL